MKRFFKDLCDLQMANNRFLKQHWCGYIIYSTVSYAVVFGGMWAWTERRTIKNKINSLTHKDYYEFMMEDELD